MSTPHVRQRATPNSLDQCCESSRMYSPPIKAALALTPLMNGVKAGSMRSGASSGSFKYQALHSRPLSPAWRIQRKASSVCPSPAYVAPRLYATW